MGIYQKRNVEPERIEFYTTDNVYAIFPVYEEKKLVYWQSRTIFDDLKAKTINPNYNKYGVLKEDYLYNYNSLKEGGSSVIVEGVFDSIHTDGICTFGHTISEVQIEKLLVKKRPNLLLLSFDTEVYEKSKRIVDIIKNKYYFKRIFLLRLGDKSDEIDPADMGANEFYRRVFHFMEKNKLFLKVSGVDYYKALNDMLGHKRIAISNTLIS